MLLTLHTDPAMSVTIFPVIIRLFSAFHLEAHMISSYSKLEASNDLLLSDPRRVVCLEMLLCTLLLLYRAAIYIPVPPCVCATILAFLPSFLNSKAFSPQLCRECSNCMCRFWPLSLFSELKWGINRHTTFKVTWTTRLFHFYIYLCILSLHYLYSSVSHTEICSSNVGVNTKVCQIKCWVCVCVCVCVCVPYL